MAVKKARVTELADVHDSKSCEVTPHVGSTPTPGTKVKNRELPRFFGYESN